MKKLVHKNVLRLAVFLIAAIFALNVFAPVGECSQSTEDTSIHCTDSDVEKHTVRDGDTLYDIASEYRIALDELIKANQLKDSMILPGQTLLLPAEAAAAESRSRINLSTEEMMLLARLIHAEARGESFEGQVAVGAVILNRLASPHFPKTIHDVVFQRSKHVYQFSPVGDGSINLEPDDRAVRAAIEAISGEDPSRGALFFYNPDISADKWIRTLPVITRIGNHVFATSY
ncbi:cell wall hydrolase [Pelotomaculum propionicicum]|uniref:cell wall hydrolase n=1 Tax=Pelotomaculum propionicicum TaxID=258475 RepID=UPI003B78F968